MKTLRLPSVVRSRLGAASLACASLALAAALSSCGDDVDVCTNPGGGCPPAFDIEFSTVGTGRFGAIQLDITHLGNSGGFIGREDKVECVPLVDAIVASNYLGERVTKVGMISLEGILMPGPIMRCGFRTRESLTADSFLVEVTDASDVASKPMDPEPTVVISAVTPR